jgi:hypothetical protein
MVLDGIGSESMDWIQMSQNRNQWWAVVYTAMSPSGPAYRWRYLRNLRVYWLLEKVCTPWNVSYIILLF